MITIDAMLTWHIWSTNKGKTATCVSDYSTTQTMAVLCYLV